MSFRTLVRFAFKFLIFGGIVLSPLVFLQGLSDSPYQSYLAERNMVFIVVAEGVGVVIYLFEFIFSWKERMSKRGIEKWIEVVKFGTAVLSLSVIALILSVLLPELPNYYKMIGL